MALGHNTRKNGKTTTYRSWDSMKQRCTNPKAPKYEYYGGRGIAFCERWASFANFLEDMGERPKGKTLDRINPHGDYCPENCRWATRLEQARNTTASKLDADRVSQIKKIRAETGMTYKALAEKFNSTYDAVRSACSGKTWKEVV